MYRLDCLNSSDITLASHPIIEVIFSHQIFQSYTSNSCWTSILINITCTFEIKLLYWFEVLHVRVHKLINKPPKSNKYLSPVCTQTEVSLIHFCWALNKAQIYVSFKIFYRTDFVLVLGQYYFYRCVKTYISLDKSIQLNTNSICLFQKLRANTLS